MHRCKVSVITAKDSDVFTYFGMTHKKKSLAKLLWPIFSKPEIR